MGTVAIVLGLLAIGEAFLIIGLRGRRIDDHPICRRCGFDLFGKAEDTNVCSECGAKLDGRRALRIGHRQRRQVLVSFGAALLVITCSGILSNLYLDFRGINRNRLKPNWLLLREAHAGDPNAPGALEELHARLLAGKLPLDTIRKVADRALAAQSNSSFAWDSEWGRFVEDARTLNLLSHEQWSLYIDQLIMGGVHFRAGTSIQSRDPLPCQFTIGEVRCGTSDLSLNWTSKLSIDDVEVPITGIWHFSNPQRLRREELPWEENINNSMPGGLGLGVHQLRLNLIGSLSDFVVHSGSPPSPFSASHPVQIKFDFDQKFEVIERDRPKVRLIEDPKLVAFIAKSMTVKVTENKRFTPSREVKVINWIELSCPPVAANLAYDVFLRANGEENLVAVFFCQKNQAGKTIISGPVPQRADIIFRPSVELAAEERAGYSDILNGDLVLHDVPLWKNTADGWAFH